MNRTRALALAVALCFSLRLPGETVPVAGSATRFETVLETRVGGQPVKMVLTGAGLRVRGLPPLVNVKVYAMGSYVEAGKAVRTVEDLLSVHAAKQLRLVLERDVDGPDLADSFRNALRTNHPAPRFNRELDHLCGIMRTLRIQKGDHVLMTHVPGQGLTVDLVGKKQFHVQDVQFSRAVWEIFLGRSPIDETLKRNLLARLAP